MLVSNIERIRGQERREVLLGKTHNEGEANLIFDDFVEMLLDDQLSRVTDFLVLKLMLVRLILTYVDRLQVEHACVVRVEQLVLDHHVEVL